MTARTQRWRSQYSYPAQHAFIRQAALRAPEVFEGLVVLGRLAAKAQAAGVEGAVPDQAAEVRKWLKRWNLPSWCDHIGRQAWTYGLHGPACKLVDVLWPALPPADVEDVRLVWIPTAEPKKQFLARAEETCRQYVEQVERSSSAHGLRPDADRESLSIWAEWLVDYHLRGRAFHEIADRLEDDEIARLASAKVSSLRVLDRRSKTTNSHTKTIYDRLDIAHHCRELAASIGLRLRPGRRGRPTIKREANHN